MCSLCVFNTREEQRWERLRVHVYFFAPLRRERALGPHALETEEKRAVGFAAEAHLEK